MPREPCVRIGIRIYGRFGRLHVPLARYDRDVALHSPCACGLRGFDRPYAMTTREATPGPWHLSGGKLIAPRDHHTMPLAKQNRKPLSQMHIGQCSSG